MRCFCGKSSQVYEVTTVKSGASKTSKPIKIVQNGASLNTTVQNRQEQANSTTTVRTNGVESSQTTSTVVQVHDKHADTRYSDTSKTVAREFKDQSTSQSSTPNGTLKKKPIAPQPLKTINDTTTTEDKVLSQKTSEGHASFAGGSNLIESSHTTIHNADTRYSDTSTTVAREFKDQSTSQSSTPNGTLKKKSVAPQPLKTIHDTTTSEHKVVSQKTSEGHVSLAKSSNLIESSHTTIHVAKEPSLQQTSTTLTNSKQDTILLSVPSLDTRSSVSSSEALTSSTENLSVSTENLTANRKESVGTLISGSARSSESLDENVVRRRSGVQVSAPTNVEVISEDALPVFKKSPEDDDKIRKAIEKNEFLSRLLSKKRLDDIINAMQLKNVVAKQKLIKQGEKGSEMFVSKEGTYKILIKGKEVAQFNDTRVFGELAILYNAKRLASIQAVTPGKVWVLDRQAYQKIVISSNLKEQDENLRFLQNVEYLNVVDVQVLRQVSNLLKPEFFAAGTVIIRQGDKGDKFYIIRAGTVTISKTGEGVLGTLGKGKCFGEMALQKEDTRQATVTAEAPGVECLTLTRTDFINHFGDVEIPKIKVKKLSFKEDTPSEYQDIKLEDLKIIKTLGVGGFGRVELVQHKKKKDLIFALKYLKKIDIVYQNQQEHVYNEKLIQMNSRSPFIVRLYRTYKDNKYVYFLMESCLGGDLFTLLHKQKGKRFEEKDAKFLSACVLEALEHLHSKGVVYRDLKPENLLIDKNGYLKLTDFGFAKKMPARGKTFTFAGTPEYVAPEIVLNRGHDKAVDYWAFGAFVFELLTGRTPFRTGDSSHMRTYNKILNGIDNANFPPYMQPKARNLIEKLCRPVPSERLGMQRGGTRDIKAHKWYQGFDWAKFQACQMPSPFKPKLKDVIDTSNFDIFKQDKDYPPDETSGWDIYF